ncbi:HSP20-like chaperone, partial [Neocallimastix californiae]
FSPKINISEDENNYYIHADLPGMTKDQVKIELNEEHILTISGERKSIYNKNNKMQYNIKECSYGKFSRSLTIPEDVDIENIQAKMANGVLEVVFKKIKPQEHQNRTIQI